MGKKKLKRIIAEGLIFLFIGFILASRLEIEEPGGKWENLFYFWVGHLEYKEK